MSLAGRVLNDRYRIERPLGSGGFAEVYLATDIGVLSRPVAIKVLHAQVLRQPDLLKRFRDEAALIANLKHPHILGVHDYGEADGAPYLVMPYVAGGTLDDHVRGGSQLDPRRVARYLRQLAGALDYAHARNIVHRDLKPSNFLLDDGDNLLLADFGIAKFLQDASQATGGTAVIGTLPYMAPEIFNGRPGPASDIYALGCIAFQLLTGLAPYSGTTQQLMYAHNFTPPPTLAERSAQPLPPALEPVLARALAKRPEDRYPTATQFADAFGAALGEIPTRQEAAPTWQGWPQGGQGGPPTGQYGQPPVTGQYGPPPDPTRRDTPTQVAQPEAGGATMAFPLLAGGNIPTPAGPISAPQPQPMPAPRAYAPRKSPWRWFVAALAVIVVFIAVVVGASVVQQENARRQLEQAGPEAQARATLTTWTANTENLFGPAEGTIKHDPGSGVIAQFRPKNGFLNSDFVSARSFVVAATFHNPYAGSVARWDYGFLFRSSSDGTQYRLAVTSEGQWELTLRLGSGTNPIDKVVDTGSNLRLDTASGGSNRLYLAVKEGRAFFFVNNQFVSKLDVSAVDRSGEISIATGIYRGDQAAGMQTGYTNFQVSRLR